ncbi:putative methyltransferase [hydrothermal vent metagenome]|uniref:Putative methyltransferase n=1 Tax=hydrothermal vent metagenome TaxID=652676 RepID=A0A3B0USL9_9ZZZZ
MQDLLGQAIYDYALEQEKGSVFIHNTYSEPDEMPVDIYFRTPKDFFDVEQKALALCKGRVLDIGAGAGALTLELQKQNYEVDALEISELASKVMYLQGVKSIITGNVYDYSTPEPYDTVLLMMNTIGLVGELKNLEAFFAKLKSLLKPNGQILFDSSDISYLYEGELPSNKYHGETDYQYEYDGKKGDWFKWLYVDFETAKKKAKEAEVLLELVFKNEETGQYLAKGVLFSRR